MNQTFYFPRWWVLVERHWAEHRRHHLLSILALAGMLLAWFGFQFIMDWNDIPRMKPQFTVYMIGLVLAGCIYASTTFSPLGTKKEAIQYLSVPASQLEKFLCALFYAVIFFFVVYTLVFYAVDICMVKLALRKGIRYFNSYDPRLGVMNIFSGPDPRYDEIAPATWLLVFMAFQSAFILGSIYFPRYSFIKTVVALLLLAGFCALFISKIMEGFVPKGWELHGLLEWGSYDVTGDYHEYRIVRPAAWLTSTLTFLVTYTIPLIFYYIAYIRLKEKEV